MEEIMGIGAGICKAEKGRQVVGAGAPQRGARSLKNTKEEERWCWGIERRKPWSGETCWVNRDPFGSPGV